MILELTRLDRDTGFEHTEHIERVHDVRSVSVSICQGPDGDHYPRLHISKPSASESLGLRPEGVTEATLFDDDVHKARDGFVVGPQEAWLRTVINRDVERRLDAIAQYDPDKDVVTIGEVVDQALEVYLEDYDASRLPEDVRKEVGL